MCGFDFNLSSQLTITAMQFKICAISVNETPERETSQKGGQQKRLQQQHNTRINNSAACWTNTYNLCTYCSCSCCGGVPHYALPSQRQIAHNYKIQWKLIYHARNIYGHAFNINFHFLSFWVKIVLYCALQCINWNSIYERMCICVYKRTCMCICICT